MMEDSESEAKEWISGRKKKKGLLLLTILIVVILVSVFFISTIDSHPGTPEDVVLEYANRINANDPDGAFQLTTLVFTDLYDSYLADADWVYLATFDYYNLTIKDYAEVSDTMKSFCDNESAKLEAEWDAQVEEITVAYFNNRADWGSGVQDMENQVPCFKIDGKWYMHWPFN